MPKDQESLQESRLIRQHLLTQWGRLPSSIWKVNWSVKVSDLSRTIGTYQTEQAQKLGKLAKESHAMTLSSAGHHNDTGISRFPQDLCQFLIKFYTNELDTVLDPFTGHNSRMESCFKCNRHYVGFDICHQFMEWNREVKAKIELENSRSLTPVQSTIELYECDSRDILDHITEKSADFCITSPPFYDVEYYSDDPEQLGKAKVYDDFIYSLGTIVQACYKVLKENSYIAWETNDFRRNGTFHTYHADLIRLFKQAGFRIHDIVIVDYGSSFLASFLSDVEHNKIMPKRHSYITVGYKPTISKQPKREDTYRRLSTEAREGNLSVSIESKQPRLM